MNESRVQGTVANTTATEVRSLLSEVVKNIKYARHLPDLGRRETSHEMFDRYRIMMERAYPDLVTEIRRNMSKIYNGLVLPSMRGLQYGGTPIEKNNARVYNCAYRSISGIEAFKEVCFLLMSGTGAGFSVRKHHVEKLPPVLATDAPEMKYVVQDSLEGWADAYQALVDYHFVDSPTRFRPRFSFSEIRPKGAALKTSGGVAPGPEPLKNGLMLMDRILTSAKGRKLMTIEAYDITTIIADSVVSAGIRTSATIGLFSPDDDLMMKSKTNVQLEKVEKVRVIDDVVTYHLTVAGDYAPTGKVINLEINRQDPKESWMEAHLDNNKDISWFSLYPWRRRSNNSVAVMRSQITRGDFDNVFNNVKEYGEPGFFLLDTMEMGANPCVEIGLQDGQFCNLTEVNASRISDHPENETDKMRYQRETNGNKRYAQWMLEDAVKAAAFFGTLQAGFQDFHVLNPQWKDHTSREALIGVSFTGIAASMIMELDLPAAAQAVLDENDRVAETIGINPAARATAVKPAGTTSMVFGGLPSGIHAAHGEYIIRRITVNKSRPIYKHLLDNLGGEFVEDYFYNPEETAVISFPISYAGSEGLTMRSEETSIQLLERIKFFYKNWILPGKRYGDITNNVSATVNVKPGEWDNVKEWMWENRDSYNGISLFPYDGGKYDHPPLEEITKERYDDMMSRFDASNVDLSMIKEELDLAEPKSTGDLACVGGACEI